MGVWIRERRSRRGTRFQVLWRLGGPGARQGKVRSAGTFSTLARAERVRDEVGLEIAGAKLPGHRADPTRGERFVYIAELGNLYKIGHSQRCRELNALLLHVEPGGLGREKELHREFKHLRSHGEFFRSDGGSIAFYIRDYAEREYAAHHLLALEAKAVA